MHTRYQVDPKSGKLSNSTYIESPNFNERPLDASINLLVIHGISLPPGEFGQKWIQSFFCNALDPSCHPYFETIVDLKVSSHLLIERDGTIWQFVPFSKRAWHAGLSVFEGRGNCNDFSIGVELEGTDDIPYTERQYHTLAAVTLAIMKAYPAITQERIVGHSDIAPDRKTDPGESFDWNYFRKLIEKVC